MTVVISCTQKLFEHSQFPVSPVPEVGMNPLYSWHAHLFRAGKRTCIMLMNDLTRYHIVLYGVKKEHYKHFDRLFAEALEANLRAEQYPEPAIRAYMSQFGQAIYTKTHNRSILGSITEQIYLTEYRIHEFLPTEEMNLISLNKINNDSPILVLSDKFPRDAMSRALAGLQQASG